MAFRVVWHVALLVACALPACAGDLFPFRMPWDDASPNLTNLAAWSPAPAGRDGFVRAEGGHLHTDAGRIRFLGVNVVFGGVAPTHDEADRIAARLARFGINAVRFHHMDSNASPNGLLQKDMRTFDPAQLERFDYFVAALKRAGIYADINLHVGRRYPGMADWGEETPKYWKGVDHFFPPMVAMQRDYARALLTHRNPYTGNRYIEEPAVALIEINNENGLIREWRAGHLDGMTEPYLGELARRWRQWLKARYPDTAALRAAWGVREEPLGPEMLDGRLGVRSSERGWNLQLVGDAGASLEAAEDGALLTMTRPGKESWHTQLHQNGLSFATGQPYTLRLALRTETPMKVVLQAMQAHAPWQSLWRQEVRIGPEWRTVEATFAPAAGADRARLTITGLGRATGRLWLKEATLRPGGLLGLLPGETLEAMSLFESSSFLARTPAAQGDWLRFLWDVETAYWTGMRDFLKGELGARPLIIGTQASYSPAPIQALMEVVDDHAYWQHPVFPGRPWDAEDWHIGNSPMAGIAAGGTLPDLALRRVVGKPFVVTEYNHSFPSHFQAEALPLLAAYAALQDWDGIFLYSYGTHRQTWDPGFVDNHFDSHANPAKMAAMAAAAALFRRGDVAAAETTPCPLPGTAAWTEVLRAGYGASRLPGVEAFGAARSEAFVRGTGIGAAGVGAAHLPYVSATGQLAWGINQGRTTTVDAPRSKGVIGARMPFAAGGVSLEITEARNDWGVLMLTLVEGTDFASPGRVLVTALGQVENTDQKWREGGRSIGRDWGRAPVLAEGIGARITLPVAAERARAWALDERGNRREEVPVSGTSLATIEIGERYRTLWYEVEVW